MDCTETYGRGIPRPAPFSEEVLSDIAELAGQLDKMDELVDTP